MLLTAILKAVAEAVSRSLVPYPGVSAPRPCRGTRVPIFVKGTSLLMLMLQATHPS